MCSSCSSPSTQKTSTVRSKPAARLREPERSLGDSAGAKVTLPLARSPSRGLSLASSVPPSRTRIPSRHSPAAGKAAPAAAPRATVSSRKRGLPTPAKGALQCRRSRARAVLAGVRRASEHPRRAGHTCNNASPPLSTGSVPGPAGAPCPSARPSLTAPLPTATRRKNWG